MTTTINAVSGTGLTQTSDGSGIVKLQSNGVATNALAWLKFVGASGTISASYNISSVTRNAGGRYTITFATALSDANYAVCMGCSRDAFDSAHGLYSYVYTAQTTTTVETRFYIYDLQTDPTTFSIAIFGN